MQTQSARAILLGALALLAPSSAHAALGGDAVSIAADTTALGATREIKHESGWETHVLHLPSGTLVQEYLRNGKVFAIAWGGPVVPDLRRLLGAYFDPYVRSPQGLSTGHHHMRVVSTPEWVVQSAGHAQAFIGRAWISAEIPSGFDLGAVRAW